MDYSKIDNIEFGGVDPNDSPDYVDAFIISADYDGKSMTSEQINAINEDHSFVYEQLITQLN